MRLSARLTTDDLRGPFATWRRFAEQRIETAALLATDRARRVGLSSLRSSMQEAGLGRLGNGLTSTSDLEQGGIKVRYANAGFSVSGSIYIRSSSERTRGAIEAYTQGADIRPVRGRWLWIATDQIPRVTGKFRMTPELYNRNGFDRKIGPLVRVKGANGYPLLIVRNVGISLAGKSRSARSLTRSGRPRKGQGHTPFVIAFIGIPRTAREARIDVRITLGEVQQQLLQFFHQALGRV